MPVVVTSRSVRVARLVVAAVGCAAVVVGCARVECIQGYPSAVRLVVPAGWRVESFCVDNACVLSTPALATYSVGVDDARRTYRYQLVIVSPADERLALDGDVEVIGNSFGGESCRPRTFSAGLIVDGTGQVTIEQP